MKKTSVIFLGIALLTLFWADLSVTSGNTYNELKKIGAAMLNPDFNTVWLHRDTILNTVFFAICGIFIGIVFGFILSFHYHRKWLRIPLSFVRSIHEIFWVLLLMTPLGLNHFTAILGIAIPYTAIIAKIYAEIIEESDKQPLKSLPEGSGIICGFLFAVLPGVWNELKSYTSYRFECALRSSAVIGFVGFPTIGYHLESYFNEGYYRESAALFYSFLILIGTRRLWLNKRFIPFAVPLCFFFVSWKVDFSWQNTARFLNEIIPYPVREAVHSGQEWQWSELVNWLSVIWEKEAWPGLWNTFILTQLALVATAFVTLISFPFSCHHFVGLGLRSVGRFTSIFFRTVPEYILAFVLILPLGPSLLPAIITIALHNGAILSHLVAANASNIELGIDSAKRKIDLYFYEILPRVYGQFLAFLFYRWEIIMRESAILGILGITTIGFYIDSAISDDRLDRAFFLICITAALNMVIDFLSVKIRQKLKVSGRITCL